MRALWLLLTLTALAVIGSYPTLAILAGSLLMATIGLAAHGVVLLLAQAAIKVLVLGAGAIWLVRQRRTT